MRKLRASATQAEQEAQYLQDNPEAAAQALKEDAESDAAAAGETNGTGAAPPTQASSTAAASTPGSSHSTAFGSPQQPLSSESDQDSATDDLAASEYDDTQSDYGGTSGSEGSRMEDSDSSMRAYGASAEDDEEEEDLESVEGLHNSIQRQRSRLQTLMTRVEGLQHLAANLEAQEVCSVASFCP